MYRRSSVSAIVINLGLLMSVGSHLIIIKVPIVDDLVIVAVRSGMSLLSANEQLMVSMRRQSNGSILESEMCC